jgi:hypothetical protein
LIRREPEWEVAREMLGGEDDEPLTFDWHGNLSGSSLFAKTTF